MQNKLNSLGGGAGKAITIVMIPFSVSNLISQAAQRCEVEG